MARGVGSIGACVARTLIILLWDKKNGMGRNFGVTQKTDWAETLEWIKKRWVEIPCCLITLYTVSSTEYNLTVPTEFNKLYKFYSFSSS